MRGRYKRKIAGFTPRAARLILERYVEAIDFRPMLGYGGIKISEKTFRFIIYISNNPHGGRWSEREQQKKTFFHELIHLFCCLMVTHVSEESIETETENFCQQHPDFCENIFSWIEKNRKEGSTEDNPLKLECGDYILQICEINQGLFTGIAEQ